MQELLKNKPVKTKERKSIKESVPCHPSITRNTSFTKHLLQDKNNIYDIFRTNNMAARGWMFTINNPTVEEKPLEWPGVKYIVFQKERGEEGT